MNGIGNILRIHVEVAAQAELDPVAQPLLNFRQAGLVDSGLVRVVLAGVGTADNVTDTFADRHVRQFD